MSYMREPPARPARRPLDSRIDGIAGFTFGGRTKGQRKILKDTIHGITKPDIRRLARRGGIKRISGGIYTDIRFVIKDHLTNLLKEITMIVDHSGRKTVTVTDVIFVLKRIGRPIYGFDSKV